MAEKLEGVLNTKELEGRLMKTKQFTHPDEMKTHFLERLSSEGHNISMPTNGYFAEITPAYRQELINLYNGTFGVYEGVTSIPDDLKVSQGALLDSLHFGVDIQTEEFALYTMNPGLFIPEMTILTDKMLKLIFEKNKIGEVKALRVDLAYKMLKQTPDDCSGSDDYEVSFKLVNHRKVIDDNEQVLLVPVIGSIMLSSVIQDFIKRGYVLKTVQDTLNMEKVRCITNSSDVLKKYCDTPEAVSDKLKAEFFPYKAFFYAPVIGAPSTTAMVTNVNLFKLCELKKLSSTRELTQLGVQKPKDPVDSMVQESVVKTILMELKRNNPDELVRVVNKLPRRDELMPNVGEEEITEKHIASYLHTIKRADMVKVFKVVPGASDLFKTRREAFTKCEHFTGTGGELNALLKTSICRVIIRKADFTLSSITCTNSRDILMKLYGENYFAEYEGFSVRLRAALSDYNDLGRPFEDAMNAYGLEELANDTVMKSAESLVKEGKCTSITDALEEAAYASLQKKKASSAQTSNIMVRTTDAYLTGNGAEDYYRYIDPSKIVNVFVLS